MFIYKTEFVTHTTSHHVNRLHFPAMTFATVMEEVLLNCMTKFCRQRSFSVPGKKSRKWLYDYTTKMASGTRRVNRTLKGWTCNVMCTESDLYCVFGLPLRFESVALSAEISYMSENL